MTKKKDPLVNVDSESLIIFVGLNFGNSREPPAMLGSLKAQITFFRVALSVFNTKCVTDLD